jgi:hypothetical protein
MFDILLVGSGTLWTIAYLLIIRRGFLDHTYGMPLVALCANLSWEFIFSFVFPHGPVQRPVNIVWFSFDLIILYQLLRYGPREFPSLPKKLFYGMVALALLTAFSTVVFITLEFEDFDGAYSAFGQNLMMSVLFIVMLYSRRSLRGQSLGIALTKTGGTTLASVAFLFYSVGYEESVLLPFLYGSILLFDVLYVAMVFYAGGLQRSDHAEDAEEVVERDRAIHVPRDEERARHQSYHR